MRFSCVQFVYILFSTLYTTLPHNLIKDKLVDLMGRTFQREGSLYIVSNDKNAFFTSEVVRNYNLCSCQNVCEALTFLLHNIYYTPVEDGSYYVMPSVHPSVCLSVCPSVR